MFESYAPRPEVPRFTTSSTPEANTLGADKDLRRPAPPSRTDVEDHLLDLISGDISRKEASDWARQWVITDGAEIEPQIWEALRRLIAADMPSTDRPFLYERIDFQAWLADLRSRRTA